jgi:hypothetical protein
MLPKLDVCAVVNLATRYGVLDVNPLKWRKWRGTEACFEAARQGKLRKERVSCARFLFYPINKVER